jgi:2-keto-4-pentenoate hydratase
MDQILSTWADQLYQAEQNQQAIAPIRDQLPGGSSVDTAYAIQDINTQRALNNGRRLVGKKIGLTSFAVQQQLGVDSPDFGMLFKDMAFVDGQTIPFQKLIQPKVEAEIALVLKADLTQAQHRIEDIVAATDYAVAAIEVVDSRIENWKISLLDTVADNASSAAFVLGQQKVPLTDVDWVNCQMQMTRQGEVVSQGQGKACLDNPLNAAVWLADEMVKRGRPLQAGDIVLTGALGPMVAVQAGEAYQVEIEGLGSVTAVFSA